MERLTRRGVTGHAYYPRCFEAPCDGAGCKIRDCLFDNTICERLAAYEDSGLTPKEVKRMSNILMDVGIDYNCSWEYVKNWLLDDRLRELAEADKDGRVVVLPCQSGERVFAILDGEKHVRECEVEHAVLDDWRKVFAIRPVGYAQNAYYAPFGAFGRTVFLTREEAKKALEAMREEDVT